MKQWKMKSPAGDLYIVASPEGLSGIFWAARPEPLTKSLRDAGAVIQQTVRELEEYFAGQRREFSLPLDPRGTEFQQKVWRELQRIPYGETISYAEIARRLRKPGASRAVGTANGRNPLSIVIPCHRVITSGGTLGGYAGGLRAKEILLSLERN